MRRTLLLLGAVIVLGIQFIRPDRSVPKVDPADDLCAALQPPEAVAALLRAACYDCHSYQTQYPWYAEVAPVSWWLAHHVDEGREHVNFSVYGTMPPRDRAEMLEECSEEVLDGHMPLRSYTWMHAKARLSAAQRRTLADWLSAQAR